ncbi:DUF2975 domain-containing protein [Agromyces subbeticus]|uniref:DUF2975 domain-containing protein n=1 Tax=Agromyces subbeticus TaxID=293890 RepID=UPI0003B554FA|nr:DUF2975 domain-containing protein [Agromyces subbeticus]
MQRIDWVVVSLRVLLVLVFIGLLVAQLMSLPGEFSQMARENPDAGVVPWLLLTFAILEVLCFQIVIVCTWRLLTLVRSDRIFSDKSFVWVDVIMWTVAAAWLVLAAVSATLIGIIYFTPELRDPGTPILLTGMTLIGAVVVLVVVVLRALLRQATVLRSDLEEVI